MNYVKNGWRVLLNYILTLVVFFIFSYIFLNVSGNSFNVYLPYYCFVTFLMAFALVYSDMKKLAIKERKPQNELNPYPVKGLLYGLVGFSPVVLLEIISALVVFQDKFSDHLKHISINVLMGPTYFLIRIFHESILGYALASLLIPAVAMLGYLAGYYGIEIFKRFKKEKAAPVQKEFKKSPWNPSVKAVAGKRKRNRNIDNT